MISFDEISESNPAQRAGRERVMEILVFLLAEMRKNKQLTEIDLKPLSQRGFNQTEISTAFSWLFDKIAISNVDQSPVILSTTFSENGSVNASRSTAAASFRIYHDIERTVMGVEAQGYLLQMRELGLVTEADMELVIDRIMMSGVHSISLPEVKELVSTMIFDFDDSTRLGSRMMLNASDRVQ